MSVNNYNFIIRKLMNLLMNFNSKKKDSGKNMGLFYAAKLIISIPFFIISATRGFDILKSNFLNG
jgi:hypothetical protein